jgi:hypothetical protein
MKLSAMAVPVKGAMYCRGAASEAVALLKMLVQNQRFK